MTSLGSWLAAVVAMRCELEDGGVTVAALDRDAERDGEGDDGHDGDGEDGERDAPAHDRSSR